MDEEHLIKLMILMQISKPNVVSAKQIRETMNIHRKRDPLSRPVWTINLMIVAKKL